MRQKFFWLFLIVLITGPQVPASAQLSGFAQEYQSCQAGDSLARWYAQVYQLAMTPYWDDNMQEGLEIIDRGIDTAWRATSSDEEIDALGRLYALKGAFYGNASYILETRDAFREAMALFKSLGEKASAWYYHILSQQAQMHIRLGENTYAELLYQELEKYYQGLPEEEVNASQWVYLHNDRGLNFEELGDTLAAMSEYRKGLALSALSSSEEGLLLSNLGMLLASDGQSAEAKRVLLLAQDALEKGMHGVYEWEVANLTTYQANVQRALGEIASKQGDPVTAVAHFTDSESIWYKLYPTGQHRQVAKFHLARAQHYSRAMAWDEALAECEQGYRSLRSSTELNAGAQLPKLAEVYNENTFFELLEQQGLIFLARYAQDGKADHLLAAKATYQRYFEGEHQRREGYLFEASTLTHAAELQRVAEQAISTCLKLDQEFPDDQYGWDALAFAERGRSLNLAASLYQQEFKTATGRAGQLLSELKSLEQDLRQLKSSLLACDSADRNHYVTQVAAKGNALSKLQAQFKSELPSLYRQRYDASPFDPSNIIQFTQEKQADLLSIYWGKQALYLFHVKDGELRYRVHDDSYSVAALISSWQEAIYTHRNDHSAFAPASSTLFATIFQPLFSDSLPKKLYIIPDGPFGMLPFDALCTSPPVLSDPYDQWPFWVFQTELNQAPSLRFLLREQNALSAKGKLSFRMSFAQSMIAHLSPLQALSAQGLSHEKDRWRSTFYQDKEALAHRFVEEAPQYQFIQLFTHAESDPNYASRSGLWFEGNEQWHDSAFFLSTAQLYEVNLNARLCLLVGCGTGTGIYAPGEGVQSLARTFAHLGSDNTVATLHMLNDYEASLFTDLYNEALLQNPDPGAALREAKLAYLRSSQIENEFKHPASWASFVMIGAGEPLSIETHSSFWDHHYWWWVAAAVLLLLMVRLRKRRRARN